MTELIDHMIAYDVAGPGPAGELEIAERRMIGERALEGLVRHHGQPAPDL